MGGVRVTELYVFIYINVETAFDIQQLGHKSGIEETKVLLRGWYIPTFFTLRTVHPAALPFRHFFPSDDRKHPFFLLLKKLLTILRQVVVKHFSFIPTSLLFYVIISDGQEGWLWLSFFFLRIKQFSLLCIFPRLPRIFSKVSLKNTSMLNIAIGAAVESCKTLTNIIRFRINGNSRCNVNHSCTAGPTRMNVIPNQRCIRPLIFNAVQYLISSWCCQNNEYISDPRERWSASTVEKWV